MTETYASLPRRIQAKIVCTSILASTRQRLTICIVIFQLQSGCSFQCQVIIYWRIDVRTDTERRILNRTEDDTQLHIEACTINLQVFFLI